MPRALVYQQGLRSYVLLSQDATVCETVSTVDYQKTRESLYVSNLASTCYIQVVADSVHSAFKGTATSLKLKSSH
jgi:hypothetical protein